MAHQPFKQQLNALDEEFRTGMEIFDRALAKAKTEEDRAQCRLAVVALQEWHSAKLDEINNEQEAIIRSMR